MARVVGIASVGPEGTDARPPDGLPSAGEFAPAIHPCFDGAVYDDGYADRARVRL